MRERDWRNLFITGKPAEGSRQREANTYYGNMEVRPKR
jgi:hypothetical protein